MYREKVEHLIDSISQSSDCEYLGIVGDLVESAAEYIKRVVMLETAMLTGKLTKEGNEYREYIQQLDSSRSAAHNKLISNVRLINKLCSINKIPVIFEGNEENRIEIANFAHQIIHEYFCTRKL